MSKLTPGIASKEKWGAKTSICMQQDLSVGKGIPVGYAIAFFEPCEDDPDKMFSFRIRLAHSPEYMDEGRKERLETALRYIMLGVQKIFDVDRETLCRWIKDDDDFMENYVAIGKLH